MPNARACFSLLEKNRHWSWGSISLSGSLLNSSHIYSHQTTEVARALVCILKKTRLVKRHQINAKMCGKLDEIKREGRMLRRWPVFWALHNSCSLKRVSLNEGLVAVFWCSDGGWKSAIWPALELWIPGCSEILDPWSLRWSHHEALI